jgi:predicted nucleic acid-binding protein
MKSGFRGSENKGVGIKAVIDANIWVSALLNPSGYPAKLRLAFEQGIFL